MPKTADRPDTNNIQGEIRFEAEPRDRENRWCLYGSAREAVGELRPGIEVFGFTKGQFSLIDIICEILRQTGPADVSISTWTAARKDIGHCYRLLEDKRARSVRWILDRSFPSRQSEYLRALVDKFDHDSVRVTRTHAKFCLIRNDDWNIVLRSSMNLNKNPRFENYEFSDSASFADFFEELVDEIFTEQTVGGFLEDSEEYERQFRDFRNPESDATASELRGLVL